MYQYFNKTNVAAAAPSAAMEAVNHLKNSAMEAENHVKHGASSKSHTSRRNFFGLVCCLLLVLCVGFSACGDDDGVNDNIKSSDIVGKWQLIESSDELEPCDFEGWIEFKSDGTFEDFDLCEYDEEDRPLIDVGSKGIWSLEGNKLTIVFDDFPLSFVLTIVSISANELVTSVTFFGETTTNKMRRMNDGDANGGNVGKKTVTMGTQNGTLVAGAMETATFSVTTTNIANGSYAATVANLPSGISVHGLVTIANNSGTLTLAGSASTVAGTTSNLTLTIDGTTSGLFALTIESSSAGGTTVTVSILAGSGVRGFANGQGTAAQFDYPTSVAVDASGNVYVADEMNHRIRKITPEGLVTTFAGGSSWGYVDGLGSEARFSLPEGIAVDADDNVYVAELSNHRIRKITPEGLVSTLAGSTMGFADGQGTAARFSQPIGVAVDAAGNVYVADRNNYRIRKITPDGLVTTLAGSRSGFADGQISEAQFANVTDVAVDASGNIYVADPYNNRIRKITPAGLVSTFIHDEVGLFSYRLRISVDASGNLYAASGYIHKITPSGMVSTIADGWYGEGTAVDAAGNIYVADYNNHRILKIVFN